MNRFMITALVTIATLSGGVCMVDASQIVIADRQGPKARIIVASGDSLMQRTGRWCRDFLSVRGLGAESLLGRSVGSGVGPVWVLETMDRCPEAKSLGINVSALSSARADAYILSVTERGGYPVVSIVGRNVQGVRSGVARLVAVMSLNGDRLVCPKMIEFRTPFLPIRRIAIVPTGRIAQGTDWCRQFNLPDSYTTWADTLWTNWSDERIRQYAEQLWLLGFNSVEFCEIRGYRGVFDDEQLRNEITPKLRVFMQAVRDNGMQVSQFIWGQSLFVEGQNLCWNSPDERTTMEQEYRRLARTYGDLVDHIVVHVGDPGGCNRNGCDAYHTTQSIATCLHDEFRNANPRCTATLNTWANAGFWKESSDPDFLDTSLSSKDMGIALHRWYDGEQARTIRKAGRSADIWGWYLSDMEMNLDMALFMRRLDAYFTALPDEASDEIRALSTEICFHGWPHIINAYVSAQKMWSPKRSLDEIEREFCAGVFGDRNADHVLRVYQACEEYVHPDRHYGFIPTTDCLPVVFGTSEYNRRLRTALASVQRIDLSELPRLTTATEPKELMEYLSRNLSLIAVFSDAHEKLESARKSGAGQGELMKIVEQAEARAEPYKIDLDYPVLSRALMSAEQLEAQ